MRIIFCIPGREYSGNFLQAWTDTLIFLERSGVEVYLKRMWSSNVYLMRNLILRDDTEENNTDKAIPFSKLGGYDYLFWIDGDQVWRPRQVRMLVEKDVDIICGSTAIGLKAGKNENGEIVRRAQSNVGYIREPGKAEFLWMDTITEMEVDEQGLIEIDFTGFGFVCVKEGVFESMSYPWFRPMTQTVNKVMTFPSEDIGWCLRVREEYGYKIYLHPGVRVGHEKMIMV